MKPILAGIVLSCFWTTVAFDSLRAETVKPEVLKKYQQIFLKERKKELNKLLVEIESSRGLHTSDSNFRSRTAPSPSGRHVALVLARATPDPKDRWVLQVQHARTHRVISIFDYIDAHDIEAIRWLDEGRLLILDRNHSLSGPPGCLHYLNLVTGTAHLLDDLVWRFTVAPGGDDVLYERSEDVAKPYDKRTVYHLKLSQRNRHAVHEVHHPRSQFGPFGEFKGEGVFFRFDVNEYGTKSFEPKVVGYWYDLMAARTFKHKAGQSPDTMMDQE